MQWTNVSTSWRQIYHQDDSKGESEHEAPNPKALLSLVLVL